MADAVFFYLQILSTFTLFGLIWFVQIIHYPLLRFVPRDGFSAYHKLHVQRAGYLIAPLMIIELICAIYLVFNPPILTHQYFLEANLISLVGIWISTFALQVPIHNKLSGGFSISEIERLIQTNWLRTCLWSFRAFMFLLLLVTS